MSNKWNERDILQLTRDCELGQLGELRHVVAVDGPYMTVRDQNDRLTHTGRNYAFATKIGEGAVSDEDFPLFSWAGDALTECEARLCEVEARMRKVPTARHCADRVAEVCARLEEIAEEFANADHMGNR